MALSILAILSLLSIPHLLPRRDLSMVIIADRLTLESFGNPLSLAVIETRKGYDFSNAVLQLATIVVGLNLFPMSFCMIRAGLSPACSLPL